MKFVRLVSGGICYSLSTIGLEGLNVHHLILAINQRLLLFRLAERASPSISILYYW